MTRQIRLSGLGMLIVFAVGMAMSGSASAHEFFVCREGGTEKYETSVCAKKIETGKFSFLPVEGTKTYAVEGTNNGVIKLENAVTGNNPRASFECKKSQFNGTIEKEGKSKDDTLILQECALYLTQSHRRTRTSCVVPNIETNPLKGELLTTTGSGPEDKLKAESGSTLFMITINSCTFEGRYELTGEQSCSLPEGAVGKQEHEIVCSPTGSSLVFVAFGAGPAKLIMDTTVKLAEVTAAWGAE
jgi:hypothetical protein